MSEAAYKDVLKNVWDDVPHPGPPPLLPSGVPPAPGDFGYAEWSRCLTDYERWLKAARRHQLASALRELEEPLTLAERQTQLDRAVRVLGCMVLAGDVSPGILGSLLDMF